MDVNRRSVLKVLATTACSGGLLLSGAIQGQKTPISEIAPESSEALDELRRARWDEVRAFRYMRQFGELKGCNYVPSDASSIVHKPNEALIRRELAWAHEVVGLNTVRVWLNLSEYQIDKDELFANFDAFLRVCEQNHIRVLPVLSIQDFVNPDHPLSQTELETPTMSFHPSVHGGGWNYPGRVNLPCCEPDGGIPREVLTLWSATKPVAQEFIHTVLTRYGKDERIILWDLYNEAPRAARPIVETVFKWARQVSPSQPLTVCWQGHDLSDVITFHTYTRPGLEQANRNSLGWDFLTELDWARSWARPMVCTEWLARPFGNTIEAILPFFERYHIGWYVWGLCAVGPAQYQFPWGWPIGSPPPEKWFHCLLYPDGTPYNTGEILSIRDFKYQEVSRQVRSQTYWRRSNVDLNDANKFSESVTSSSIHADAASG